MTTDVLPWLEYRWTFDFPTGMYRAILERLRGTPARLDALARDAAPGALSAREPGKWSAHEQAGHFLAVETLWQVRIREFLAGAASLTAADMRNRATDEGGFAARGLADILGAFRSARAATMAMLDPLTLDDAARVAHHPRLDRQIRLVDLCFFAAEHDDHHLAVIRGQLELG